jgi:uncharacterized protein
MSLSRRTALKFIFAAAGAALAGCYPVFIERNLLQINRYRIPVPRLPRAFEGFTIVHLTDLHYGSLVSLKKLHKVIETANSIPRDMIMCTGDYVQEYYATEQVDAIWPLLGKLHAPHGVLSVLGNHDHWADTERSLYWLKKTGQGLRNSTRKIEKAGESLWFAGGGDLWEDHFSVDLLLEQVPQDGCVITAVHNPDSADTVLKRNPDLFITGHTHGGQVDIPFVGTPILPVRNKNYTSGLKYSNYGIPVFISKGIGWAMYPVRFNCVPEIAVLTLTGKVAMKET